MNTLRISDSRQKFGAYLRSRTPNLLLLSVYLFSLIAAAIPASAAQALADAITLGAGSTVTAPLIEVEASRSLPESFSQGSIPEAYIAPTTLYRFSNNLVIEPITAYNAIVDSNVLSPSSYGPNSATMGARFCNNHATNTLTNVWAYIGTYNATTDVGTPGTYPVRNENVAETPAFTTQHSFLDDTSAPFDITTDFGGPSFSLEHEGGSANDAIDASRYIGSLAPGQCRTEYWLVSYPRKALVNGNWVSVTGGVKPDDDLWLPYYFWGKSDQTTDSGADGNTNPDASYYWRPLTMRNEISAMANKIWPNGDNKVPDQYVDAISQVLGWDTITPSGNSTVYPGQTVTSQGIWYDFGNVGAGFDNNYDLVPDRNAWMQPIGDHTSYDPGCFRLVRTYGIVIVKLVGGGELLIPFVDQMYFENIPDNTGTVGLIFYEYAALDGACTANLTPYQEVASGFDNEKFNADFGAGIPPLQSTQTSMSFDKSGATSLNIQPSGGSIQYTMTFTLPKDNDTDGTSDLVIGNPGLGTPLVIQEAIPAGTSLTTSPSAPTFSSTPAGLTATVLYSHDNGVTWSTTMGTASTVTHIQWWINQQVSSMDATDQTGTVTFYVSVPSTFAYPLLENIGCLKLGNADCFKEDKHSTLITGTSSITGSVFCDDGTTTGESPCDAGTTTGVVANGLRENGIDEPAIGGVPVKLYYDVNNNNKYDPVLTYTVIDGKIDFNGIDGVTGNDDGTLNGFTITDGLIYNGASLYTGYFNGYPVYSGLIDIDYSTAADSVDDGSITFVETELMSTTTTAYTITDGVIYSGASTYTGSLLGYSIVNGLIDLDGLNGVTAADDTATVSGNPTFAGFNVINGYLDTNRDGDTTTPDAQDDGSIAPYYFANLPVANYVIVVDGADTDIPDGYTNSTPVQLGADVTAAGTRVRDIDFAFAPALTLVKRLDTPQTTTVGENQIVQYTLRVTNNIPGSGTPNNYCSYKVWAGEAYLDQTYNPPGGNTANAQWKNVSNAVGAPDEMFAYTDIGNTINDLGLGGFNIGDYGGTITSVKFIANVHEREELEGENGLGVVIWYDTDNNGASESRVTYRYNGDGILVAPATQTVFQSALGTEYVVSETLSLSQVTGRGSGTWLWSDFAPGKIEAQALGYTHQSGKGDINLDAFGFLITTDEICDDPAQIINPLPLTDTFESYYLDYLSANPPYSSSSVSGTGTAELTTLTWDNLGPLYPGQTKEIVVQFHAENRTDQSAPDNGNGNALADNTATVNSAKFGNGRDTNDVTDDSPVSIIQSRSVSGYVWADWDNQGWEGNGGTGFDGSDGKIGNVLVQLLACIAPNGSYVTDTATNKDCAFYNGQWLEVATTLTDSAGYYIFEGLYEGYYRVVIDPPTGSNQTLPTGAAQTADPDHTNNDQCGDNGVVCDEQKGASADNLANTNSGGILKLTGSTVTYSNINFGYYYVAGVYGNVWEDVDGDGNSDNSPPELGEGVLSGVTVQLYANSTCTGTPTTDVTDEYGNYYFGNLTTSTTYCLKVLTSSLPEDSDADSSWSNTDEDNGATDDATNDNTIIFTTGGSSTNYGSMDFAWYRSGSYVIGDTLFYDWDGDGVKDSGDEGIKDVTVYLYEDSDGDGVIDYADLDNDGDLDLVDLLITSDVTDENGAYSFTGLAVRNYIVVVDTNDAQFPELTTQTLDDDEYNTDGNSSNDPDPCTICDSRSNVLASEMTADDNNNIDDQDFGYYLFGGGSIGDTVWKDLNGDGIKSGTTEVGIPFVTVYLQADLNGDGTFVTVKTDVTDANGNYLFEDLPTSVGTGTGLTSVTYRVVIESADADLPIDGFGIPFKTTTASTYTRTLNSTTTSYMDADFGFAPLASIGDTVFWDANGNGTQDFSETGIPDKTVRLFKFIDELNGVYDFGESFTDTDNDGVRDADESYVDANLDGIYNGPETFTDTATVGHPNKNGRWDDAEYFIDLDNDGVRDSNESYTDRNGNGVYDPAEPFVDATGHGGNDRYDPGEYFFTDTDGNGVFNSGTDTKSTDPYGSGIVAVASTTTAADDAGTPLQNESGKYLFTGLDTDKNGVGYVVVVEDRNGATGTMYGYALTSDPNTDGVICGSQTVCDDRDGMVLYNGSNYMGADFGYQPLGVIGDRLWIDSDNDGISDYDEQGIPLITVRLYTDTDADGILDAGETTYIETETDINGYYNFQNVANGTYIVKVNTSDTDFPSGILNTYDADQNATCADATCAGYDSEVNVTVASGNVSVVGDYADPAGDGDPLKLDADFGYRYVGTGSLSGTICLDDTTNVGACGVSTNDLAAGEVAYDGVTVYLYRWVDGDSDGVVDATEVTEIASTQTLTTGNYSFNNLPINFYYIVAVGAPQTGVDLTTTTATGTPNVGDDNPAYKEAVVEVNDPITTNENVSAYQIVQVNTGVNSDNIDFAYKPIVSYDYGDLPASYSLTLITDTPDGARHTVPTTPTIYLGSTAPDAESNGITSSTATGDNTSAANDEDGVSVPFTLVDYNWRDGTGQVQVDITAPSIAGDDAYLVAWIDFNNDGDFTDAYDANNDGDYTDADEWREMIINTGVSGGNDQNFSFKVPTLLASDTQLNSRFRLFTTAPALSALAYSGPATGGEVEDYQMYTPAFNFGHLPSGTYASGLNLYDSDTSYTDNGAQHITDSSVRLGESVPFESNGVHTETFTQQAGENGVMWTSGVTWKYGDVADGRGGSITVEVTCGSDPCYLAGWIDWNGDGDFNDFNDADSDGNFNEPGDWNEKIISQNVSTGTPTFTFNIPGGVAGENYNNPAFYPRFRLYADEPNTVSPSGLAITGTTMTIGEVEDYKWIASNGSLTPITLSYFSAVQQGTRVKFAWSTETETGNAGFNLYEEVNGEKRKINPELILSSVIDSLERVDYNYTARVDSSVYWIEDVSVLGETKQHGPFELGQVYGVRVTAEAVDLAAIQAEHIAKETRRQDLLQDSLAMPATALQSAPSGKVQMAPRDKTATPQAQPPVKRKRATPTPTRKPKKTRTPVPSATPLPPTETQTPEPSATLDPTATETMTIEPTATETATIEPTATETATNTPEPTAIPVAPNVRTLVDPNALQLSATLNLKVKQNGIYRVTYEQLREAGLDLAGVPAEKITILNRGWMEPVYIHVPDNSAPFGAGGYIEFYGEGLDTLYTDTNIYTVQVINGLAPRMKEENAAPGTEEAASAYEHALKVNNQKAYSIGLSADDPWYDTSLIVASAPKTWTFTMPVNGLADVGAGSELHLNLLGMSRSDVVNPDHHLVVSVNGVPVADERFDGVGEQLLTVRLPDGLLQDGANTLQLTLPADTGAQSDVLYLNRYHLKYQRKFVAENGQLIFVGAGSFRVTNLPGAEVSVYRLEETGVARLNSMQIGVEESGYSVAFAGSDQTKQYMVVSAEAIRKPELEVARAQTNLNRPADYLIIAHSDFIGGLGDLIAAKEAQGLNVSVVDVKDIYAQYSHGIFDASAIKAYIVNASKNLGVKYILLVGGDTYDYRNYRGLNSVSFIPSLYAATGEIAHSIPADALYVDVNGDSIPDVAIGRFPVRTTAELTTLVNKTLAYQSKSYGQSAVFASDKHDGVVNFKALSEGMLNSLPEGWNGNSIHLDDVSVSAAKTDLISRMNSGVALVNFVGHSGATSWTFSGLFANADAANLTNAEKPFVVVQWGCWNTYYVHPVNEALVQKFLFSGDKGAAAVLGATTLADSESERLLGELLLPKLTTPGMTLGMALRDAKLELAQTHPELLDVLLGYSLMGDPALSIQP